LDINPKFSQAAFYLAAIENKRGNFEKSIDLYNYALSKDKIPVSGYKASSPFVSIDIGVACDNTIKANISGGMHNLLTDLQSINSVRIEDIRNNNLRNKRASNEKCIQAQKKYDNPSNISTNVTKQFDDRTVRHTTNFELKSDTGSTLHPSRDNRSITITEGTPVSNKKQLRKKWREIKNGTAQNKHATSEIVKSYPQEFYSVGNSIHKTESISIASSFPVTSNIPSSTEGKSTISRTNKPKKEKPKAVKVNFLNFSDRTLSSKLYSIKRKEIDL
jgi:hypothetical protein